jgi:ATP-dependent DNA helicase RecG
VEIAARIGGITTDGLKYQLDKLKRAGLIKRIGPAKGGYWEVGDTPNGRQEDN